MSKEESKGKYIIWEPFLLAAMVVIGMIIGNKMDFYHEDDQTENQVQERRTGQVEQLLRFIESKYVEDVDGKELSQKAINAILDQLDPHSQYLSPTLRQELEEDMNGAYLGIGVEKIRLGDSLFVISTSEGSPAEAVGIEVGDRIIAVNDTSFITEEMSDDSISILLKGDMTTLTRLTIAKMNGDTVQVELGRSQIPIPAVDLATMINDSIGYIKINRFSNDIYKEFMQEVESLANEGMDDIIIDLRGNPGGYLQEAVKILSQLIDQKESLLVYTEGAHSKRTEYKSTGRRFYEIDDIVVLTDAGSASASEIMAGALQDLDRGLVVGRRTFGKGLVQEQYRLNNGAALRLTTAKYFTPSGRLIQRDYTDQDYYEQEALSRDVTGETQDEKLIPIEDSTEHYTISGRIVYGGGGIVPDVFVPKSNPFTASDWPHIAFYLQAYLVQNLETWSQWKDKTDAFVSDFEFSSEELEKILTYIEHHWPISTLAMTSAEKAIERHGKAYLAKMLFNSSHMYHRVLQSEDGTLEEALSLIEYNKIDPLLAKMRAAIRE